MLSNEKSKYRGIVITFARWSFCSWLYFWTS